MAHAALIGAATTAAKALANLVASRAWDEVYLAWDFKNQLVKLNQKLEYIQAFLEDAGYSENTRNSKLVDLWMQRVTDAAYLADDVMDEYTIEIFRRKMEPTNFREEFCNLCTSSNPMLFHIGMAHKVKEIISLFNEIDTEARIIGFNQVDVALNQVDIAAASGTHTYNDDDKLDQTLQHGFSDSSEFVGREEERQNFLEFVYSPSNYESPGLSTVAIVGMEGMGKTALTRHLYDHGRICAYFGNNKIWMRVSKNFEIKKLLNEMVESITSTESKLSNTDAIIRKLQDELKGKKFLIVFDDVSNNSEDSWNCLKGWLHRIGGAPGSVFLINTRSDEVAKAARAVCKHKLVGLSTNEGWSLLQQIVSVNNPIDPTFEEVGRRIVEKCRGVPSAIKVIGSLLQSKQHLHEWELIIEKSERWNQNQILPSLLLSFNQLSPLLKQCFAYCAIIPYGDYVHKGELIGLWLSQGYLRNEKGANLTMEEIGDKNLKILVDNSLIEECVSLKPGIVSYKMHNLVYNLAVYVCGSDLIKKVNDLYEAGSCRHLIFNMVENVALPDVPPKEVLSKLRTLSLKGNMLSWNILAHTKYLRTLKLDRCGITEVPPIELLKHLRCLDVSYNPISTLPDSIGKLYQLQTLILQGCKNMKKLPKVVNNLVNLRHILTTAPMFAWKGLQQLTNLQSLPCISLDDDREGWGIDELGDLHQLKDEIYIQGLEFLKDNEQARKSGLIGKTNVYKLTLCWAEVRELNSVGSCESCDEDVLEGLEPHPKIESFEVQNFTGVRFPIWITGMSVLTEGCNRIQLKNLTTVKLLNCSRCQTLPKLGQLPLLKCVIMTGFYVEYIGVEFYGGDDLDMPGVVSFQYLQELEISGFRRLLTWMEPPSTAFPSLHTLRIRDCDRLNSVPVFEFKSLRNLELRHLNSVKHLDVIKYSLGLTSLIINMLPKVTSLPQELANCKKLHILNISNCDGLLIFPRGLELLDNLQSMIAPNLQSFRLVALGDDGEGCSVHELRDEIHITGLECVKDKEQAMIVGLAAKKNVSRLILSWTEGREENNGVISDEHVLEGLDPHQNIASLELKNYIGTTFPVWITRMAVLTKEPANKWIRLNNLSTLKLLNCARCQTLPKLGQLPFLEYLSMSGLYYIEHIGNEFYGGDDLDTPGTVSFNCLKELVISGFRRLVTWLEPPKAAFPSLETLQVRDCDRLNSVPAFESNSLVNLELKRLNSVECLDILKFSLGVTSLIMDMLPKVATFPQELANCQNLKQLNISNCDGLVSLPRGFENIVNPQSVMAPNVLSLLRHSLSHGERWSVIELEDEINITDLQYVKDEEQAKKVSFVAKTDISRLTLAWAEERELNTNNISDELVLKGLDPHPNITSLELRNFTGVKFPAWITRMAVLTEVPTNTWTPLHNLTTIKLLNCNKCHTLPNLGQLPFLKCLILNGLDVEIIGLVFYGDLTMPAVPFKCLRDLEISGFRKLVTWMEPPEVAFPCLGTLRIRECRQLKAVPALSVRSLISLQLEHLDSVETLDIIKHSSGLTYLIMKWLPQITSLPQELANCRKLQVLHIVDSTKLTSLPTGLESLVNLQSLKLHRCTSLVFIMDDLFNVRSSLHILEIVGCPSLRKIPSSLEECTSLENLTIKNCLLTKFSPISIRKLQRLSELGICCSSAGHLRSVLEVAQYLPLLYKLEIEGFGDENEMGEYFSDMTPFLRLPSLTELILRGHPNIKTLPQQLGLLTRITSLFIWGFHDLEEIPAWIGNLSSLVRLILEYCKNLEGLPSKENLQRLTHLRIAGCPKLVERCKEGGPEWDNISHINWIKIDGKILKNLFEE